MHYISNVHHIMKYIDELFFVHSDFSLTPLLTSYFSLNHKHFYYIYMYVNSVLIFKLKKSRVPS